MDNNTKHVTSKYVETLIINAKDKRHDFIDCYFTVDNNVLSVYEKQSDFVYNYPLANVEMYFYQEKRLSYKELENKLNDIYWMEESKE